ncbi:MAG: TraB/GumN family protein [Candidatus Aenigmarchaeota archaeon]|nr:TraB/GumN family protein [Candidatus Aenigmarchaeota archaeon]
MVRIILVPTSHVAEESLKRVEAAVEGADCVAVELDPVRYAGLKAGGGGLPPVRAFGIGGFLVFWLMKKIQDWLGKKVGILPGSEMLHAVELAQKRGVDVHFIDRNIQQTFLGIKNISWGEKFGLFTLLVKGVVLSPFLKDGIDLRKVPEEGLVEEAMDFLRSELPAFYKVLISDRDAHMAKQLLHLSQHYSRIVAVIGAGHREGIEQLLRQHTHQKSG